MQAFSRVVILVLCCMFGLAIAVSPASAQAPGTAASGSKPALNRDEAVFAALEQTIVDAEYDRIDLERVIQDLREKHKLNIHVSWTALETAGVRRDQRIEVHLKQVSLATLLDIILREAAGAVEPLSYHVANGVLIISTGESSQADAVLRTYDITDLLESGYAIRRFANTPVLGMELTGREFVGGEKREVAATGFGGGGGGGAGGGSLFGDPGENPARLTEMERAQQFVDLIQEHVEPDSWRDLGGAVGSIHLIDSTLLILHTLRTHQRIAEFLELLRAAKPSPLDADAAIVRLRADKAAQWRQQIGTSFPRLTPAQAEQVALAPSAEGVLFRASTSGFNGDGLFFSALTQRDVLEGVTAVVGDGVNAFAPVSSTATAGLELVVLPLLSHTGDELTVDVQMAWVPSTQVQPRGIAPGPNILEATIDQTLRSMRTVSSTTKVSVGDAIALTVPSQLSEQGGALEWEDWLIVRVRKPAE